MENKIAIKIASKAVSDILSGMGIYPKSRMVTDKENNVINSVERTEWQNGWNSAIIEVSKKIHEQLDQFDNGISDDLALLMIADVGWLQKDGKFRLNMNDTFWYACADCEDVDPKDIPEVAGLFCRFGYPGLTYWVSEKRQEQPQIPKYREEVKQIKTLMQRQRLEAKLAGRKKPDDSPDSDLIAGNDYDPLWKMSCTE